jgi:NitT/TauT family transport system substrate-binding protein
MLKRRLLVPIVAVLLAVTMVPDHGLSQAADRVTLQLKWVTQAQFAGYYAAKAKGLYQAEKLDVTIRPGGPDICPNRWWLVAALSSESTGCRAFSPPVTRVRR